MRYGTIFRILGILLMLFSFSMLPPIGIGLWYDDGGWAPFFLAFCTTGGIGLSSWFLNYHAKQEMKIRDGFLIVVLFWLVLSLFGSLPLLLSIHLHLGLTDAVFEAVSGLTTTGASILNHIDHLPHAILYYRQQLHFLGGMGVVILAVAIFPMLGIGGLQLYQAEIPGPSKDTKLTPRIAETAKALWSIYFGLTVLCALSYWSAGMPLFNAIGESYSTVSTGGFAMHDQSMDYYKSELINYIAVVFMFLGGVNFTLHFGVLRRGNLNVFFQDEEFKMYFRILFFSASVTILILFCDRTYLSPSEVINKGLFNVVSIATTTGYTVANFESWPSLIPFLFLILPLMGGCASSTSGGMKVIRWLLLFRQGIREIRRLIHPNAIIPIKVGGIHIDDNLIQGVWGFIAIFFLLFIFLALMLSVFGMSLDTIPSALIACITNLGVGTGDVASGFGHLNVPCKWILISAMILGRLEVFTVLVLFMPDFWRR
jgi:trk system potassium uptake protein